LIFDPIYLVPLLLLFAGITWFLLKRRPWVRLLEVLSVVMLLSAVVGILAGSAQLFGFGALAAVLGAGFLATRQQQATDRGGPKSLTENARPDA
jgi:hypothetical protein